MKYKKLLFTLLILLFPVVVFAENVSIKSVKLEEKSELVEEINEPSYSGLTVNFDVRFKTLGDTIKYEVVVDNKDEENYFVDLKLSSTSKYLVYSIDGVESTNIIKGGSTTKLYITIKYNTAVPSYKLDNNKYTENEIIKLSLTDKVGDEVIVESSSKNAVINPETGNIVLRIGNTNIAISLYVLSIVLIITILLIIVLRKIKVKKYISVLLVLLMLIPGMVSAIKVIYIEINSNIEIEPLDLIKFTLYNVEIKRNIVPGNEERFSTDYYLTITNEVAEKGMTLEEWTNSKYNTRNIKVVDMERAMSDENYMMSFVDGKCIDYSSFVEYDYLVEAFGSDLKEGKLTKNGNHPDDSDYFILLDEEITNNAVFALLRVNFCDDKINSGSSNEQEAPPGGGKVLIGLE